MYQLILLIISVLPIIIIGKYIYNKDKEKEPTNLLAKLFIYGLLATILVIIISIILEYIFSFLSNNTEQLNTIELMIKVFIEIALIEEFSKWIVIYKIAYNHEEFNEFYDMIVYAAFVSLGFACIENILYVLSSGIGTGILRALLSVPGHACYGVFMGYYLGLAKISKNNQRKDLTKKNLLLSITIPTMLHGIYDYCLISKKIVLLLLLLIFIIILYIKTFKKIKKISKITEKIKYKDNYCPVCGRKINSNYCPNCGRKND